MNSPQNLEAEKAVLGGILLDNRAIADLPARLKADTFYLPSHGQIFDAMLALWNRETPIDAVSVADHLKKQGQDISVSSLIDLTDLGMPQSIGHNANLVLDTYHQRQTIQVLQDNLNQLRESPDRADEIIAQLSTAFSESDNSKGSTYSLAEVMVAAFKRLERSSDKALLIPTGFTALDEQIGGIEKGELATVGGRPSMGKTSLAVDIALNASFRGFKVQIISVETTAEKLGIRMLSRETKINSRKLRTAILDNSERSRLVNASGKLSRLPVTVTERESNWENIKRQIRQQKRYGLDLVILDYLTLLDIPTGKYDRRDIAVGRVANEAKQLALSLNLAFILLSQLNRKTEDRGDPEPNMSDLRDSGDIEQASDVIIFPFRPVVYDPDYKPADKAFLKVAKGRDLPTGKIPVRFNKEITSFSDWSEF